MIKEWIQYLRSDAPNWALERGLIYESIALQARHDRLKRDWAPHIQQTQDSVRDFLHRHKFIRRVLVLGSGPLHDFPKDLVEDESLSLVLVDAVHPTPTKRWASRHGFQMLSVDLAEKSAKVKSDLAGALESVDAVVSLNLLSQLPLSRPNHEGPMGYASEHLDFLRSVGKPVLLVSDFLRIRRDRQGRSCESEPTIPRMARPVRQWSWSLAPIGEVSRHFSIDLEVGVWTLKQIHNSQELFSRKISQLEFL